MRAKLGSLCTFLNGGTPSRQVLRFFEGDVPWITGADIVGPEVGSARSHITREAIERSATNLVPKGTVLLVTRTSVGKVGVASLPLCFSQDITALKPDKVRIDTHYLVEFLKTQAPHLARVARGATIKGVTREHVAELSVPLPPIKEQRRIAAVLAATELLRAKRRATLALLDSLTSAVFLEMFGDPVVNPNGLPVSRLSELGTLDRGVSKHRPRNAPELLGGLYPLIQTGEIANCEGYLSSHTATYSQAGLNQSKLWPAGTLCITIAANIAKTGILMFDSCFPDSVVGFRSDSSTVEYVRVWLSFLQKTLEDNAPESAQKNINLALLRQLPVPIPSMAQRQLFADRVTAVQRLRLCQRQSLEMLDSLFASLQHQAFNGELKLAEIGAEMSSK